MSDQNWAVRQSINLTDRTIVLEMGIIDMFGEFHGEPDLAKHFQHPSWPTMSEPNFLEAAKLAMEMTKQQHQ